MLGLGPSVHVWNVSLGLLCLAMGYSGLFADESGQIHEATIEASGKEYVVPVLGYSFDRDLEHAAPLDYHSAKSSGLPLALKHRVDAIWSGGRFLGLSDTTASDYPLVAEVSYRLRRSPWSDPERMVEARLLDGSRFQGLVAREFGKGQEYEMSIAVQHYQSVLSGEGSGILDQTSIPVELRADLGQNADFIAGMEFSSTSLTTKGDFSQSSEQAAKVGFGSELSDGLYGEVTAGGRNSQFSDGRTNAAFELDAAIIWQAGSDSQYSLTFNRSVRPSLIANGFVEADTVSFTGDFTLSDMWSAYYGVSNSWVEMEPSFGKDIFSGEMAVSFSPTQSISFSGGYVYRSGSLSQLNEFEAEQIIRLSASVSY